MFDSVISQYGLWCSRGIVGARKVFRCPTYDARLLERTFEADILYQGHFTSDGLVRPRRATCGTRTVVPDRFIYARCRRLHNQRLPLWARPRRRFIVSRAARLRKPGNTRRSRQRHSPRSYIPHGKMLSPLRRRQWSEGREHNTPFERAGTTADYLCQAYALFLVQDSFTTYLLDWLVILA